MEQLKKVRSRFVGNSLRLVSSFGIIIFLILLCVFFEAMTPTTQVFSKGNIWTILGQTAINTIIAVGMTFVIISGGIDLSVGSIVALAGVLSMAVMRHGIPIDYPFNDGIVGPVWNIGWAITASLVVSLFIGLAAGLHNGLPITLLRVPPFIATLGVMTAAKGFAFVYSGGTSIGQLPPQFTNVVNATHWFLPVVAVSVVACGSAVLRYTKFGRSVYAIGGN
jgi:ribose/xylose/arabinose/galactoside ABC-type transport system permease subunit